MNNSIGEIYKKIPLVMQEIGAIGKDRKNPQQGYSFRGIDDVYNAVNSALSRHGVFCVPVVENMTREERQTKSGSNLIYTILTVKYTFFAVDGSFVEIKTIGEAMDSGDKSCNKAMSAAQKYAFLQMFCIPTEETKDTETETHEIIKKPLEGSSKDGTEPFEGSNEGSTPSPSTTHPIGSIEDFMLRIEGFKNQFEATNWKRKHQSDIDKLLVEDKTVLMDAYFKKLAELKRG